MLHDDFDDYTHTHTHSSYFSVETVLSSNPLLIWKVRRGGSIQFKTNSRFPDMKPVHSLISSVKQFFYFSIEIELFYVDFISECILI
jgi:hypothetical protein